MTYNKNVILTVLVLWGILVASCTLWALLGAPGGVQAAGRTLELKIVGVGAAAPDDTAVRVVISRNGQAVATSWHDVSGRPEPFTVVVSLDAVQGADREHKVNVRLIDCGRGRMWGEATFPLSKPPAVLHLNDGKQAVAHCPAPAAP